MRALTQYAIRNTQYAIRSPWLYACFLLSLAIWVAAWQARPAYSIDVGGIEDDAFVSGFHAKEETPEFSYRWSGERSAITLPGVGNSPVELTLRVVGVRPADLGIAPPEIAVTVRGQAFRAQTTDALADYKFAVGRGDRLDGNLIIELRSPTFEPPGDPRSLGVVVDGIDVLPAGDGPWPLTVPPVDHIAFWTLSLVLLYVITAMLTVSQRGAALACSLAALALAGLALWRRPELGLLAPRAPVLLLWGLLLATGGLLPAHLALRLAGSGAGRAAAATAGAFVAGFLLRFGGMVYPQFRSSDINFHVHRIEDILRGTYLIQSALPDGTPVPYGPALYILLAPLAGLVPDLSLLLRFTLSLLDAATAFILLYLGVLLFRSRRAGAWAAWFYALLPAPFLLFSPGNYSNLFSQFTFALALAALLRALVVPASSWGTWLLLGAALFLTFVGHYGMLVAAGVVAGFLLLLGLLFGDGLLRRRLLMAALVALLALGASFAAYYRHFMPLIAGQIESSLAQVPGEGSTGGGFVSGVVRMLGLGIGWIALPAGLAGWAARPGGRHLRRLLPVFGLAYLLATALVAVLTVAAGDNTRYLLLLAPLVALGAGRFSAALAGRRPACRAFAALAITLLCWHLLDTWLDLVFHQYHET